MKRALCVGINDYPGTESDLAGCINDANDWSKVLSNCGFEITQKLNDSATREGIINTISYLVDETKKGDSLIITYSGHGTFVPDEDGDEEDGADEALVPYDILNSGPITDDELSRIFANVRDGSKAVFISDSCHSGSVAKFAPILTPPTTKAKSAPQRVIRFLPPQVFLPTRVLSFFSSLHKYVIPTKKKEGILLMAGCQDHEYSYDAWFQGRANGAFTFVALRALDQLPKNATYYKWFREICNTLPSRQYPQTPNLEGTPSMRKWRIFS